jgi:hypothetical protein
MTKKIQRKSDNKFLLSLDSDLWVENIKESKTFKLDEFKDVFNNLLLIYIKDELKVYTNYFER